MAKGSGFFKGEKKKQKKTKNTGFSGAPSGSPTYSMPEVIPNKKKNSSW
jgi:hypothetical protein